MTARTIEQYGGRQRRYKVTTGRLLGVMDPWERRSLEFRNERAFDLWLLRRADPTVVAVDIKPPPLEYLKEGRRVRCSADLAVLQDDGNYYDAIVWGDGGDLEARTADLKVAANAHQIQLRVTSTTELRAHSKLIDTMERIRQSLVLWLDHELHEVRDAVLDALKSGTATRGHIWGSLERGSEVTIPSAMDVAIYRLYFERKLSFDLNGGLQNDSVVQLL